MESLIANTRYNASLVECGAVIQESLILLYEFQKNPDWKTIKKIAYSQNILSKRSSTRTKKILRSFRKRFVDQGELPNVYDLSCFLKRDLSSAAKTQSLFPYVASSDALFSKAVECLVSPQFEKSNADANLSKSEVKTFLEELEVTHYEIHDCIS